MSSDERLPPARDRTLATRQYYPRLNAGEVDCSLTTIPAMDREEKMRAMEGLMEHHRRRRWRRVRHFLRKVFVVGLRELFADLRSLFTIRFPRIPSIPWLRGADRRAYQWMIADWFVVTLLLGAALTIVRRLMQP